LHINESPGVVIWFLIIVFTSIGLPTWVLNKSATSSFLRHLHFALSRCSAKKCI
jgi:hypothetical protein